ncbi:MAG: 5-oxoprolinase [Methylococcaceae bacterium TMED69]|nr:MAG: 5-oxoprolinase [Methylococcaceae bacterium TMED69]
MNNGWCITVDTGGTFTDVVVSDEEGKFTIGKALTTPDRIFVGLREAIEDASSQLGLSVTELLERTQLFVYGTTRATNAIVTRKIAKTAFLTTKGFPDVLVLREGGKFDPHEFSIPYPQPYIPRRYTFEIDERIESNGHIYKKLDEEQVVDVIKQLDAKGYEAIGVSFLWAIRNPVHEKKVGQLLQTLVPEIPFTLSHELNPIMREYRRASSVVIDASIKPLMQNHLTELQTDLRQNGYSGELLVSTTIGGCMDIDSVIYRPIHTVRSGPAMAPVAGKQYAKLEDKEDAVLVVDTGGTTFDVSLVVNNNISITQETWLGGKFTGDMLGIPAVDARSVGAGGGSIAWIDSAGLLKVGPQSAGASPGPACYNLGGKLPTVTDAALLLGYIDPNFFLGGRMLLNEVAAREAIKSIADPLGIPLHEAAYSIYTVSNETMINAIKDITVSEGIDPSEAVIVAGGGAAGFGIVPIAEELKCQQVIIPRTASVLSASGMQFSDISFEHSSTFPTRSDHFDRNGVGKCLAEIKAHLSQFAERLEKKGFTNRNIKFRVDAHYAAQVWDISVDLNSDSVESDEDVLQLIEEFHKNHNRIYSVDDRESPIDFLNWTGTLVIELPKKDPFLESTKSGTELRQRNAFFGVEQAVTTRIYKGLGILPNTQIKGPAIIEEPNTTIVIPPRAKVTYSDLGSYIVDLSDLL